MHLREAKKEIIVKYQERNKLHNRIKMLKREKHRAYSKEKKRSLEKKILETEQKNIESKRNERLENEKQCIDCMKEILGFIILSTNKETEGLKWAPSRKIKNLYMIGKKYVNV